MCITIVTAIFKLSNKYDRTGNIYIEWIKNFFENVRKCPMVIFTDDYYYEHVVEFRKHFLDFTKIIKINMKEFRTNKYKNYYEKYKLLDPEWTIHNSDLYMIWNEKSEFLKKACDKNYFHSEYFIWMDAGMIRQKSIDFLLHSFPSKNAVKKVMGNYEITLLEINDKWRNIVNLSNIFDPKIHNFIKKNTHIGGTFMGTKSGIYKWCEDFYKLTDEYIEKGLFIGKDQNLMAHMVLLHNNYIKTIDANFENWVTSYQPNPWFSWINLLTPHYITVFVHAGLGNQLFQVATSYGLSRKYDRICILSKFGGNKHSKINYVSTIFKKFTTLTQTPSITIEESEYETVCKKVEEYDENILLNGYFQDYKYFDEYKKEIMELFEYSTDIPITQLSNSFYFHLRFGDFEQGNHKINQIPFYKKAIQTILEKHKTATFIVCFYDPSKRKNISEFLGNICKNMCEYSVNDIEKNVPVKFILINEPNELVTLNIFKNCRMGGIGPHSTFSWWGGYLNPNPEKEIYIPNKWLNTPHNPDSYFFPGTIQLKY